MMEGQKMVVVAAAAWIRVVVAVGDKGGSKMIPRNHYETTFGNSWRQCQTNVRRS
jgi:hypothetical protein